MNIPVSEIAELVGGTVIGDAAAIVTGVNAIQQAGPGDLSFVRDARYRAFLETTAAAAVFVPRGIEGGNVTLIQVSSPDVAFAQVLQRIEAEQTRHPKGIHPSAVVGEGVVLGKDVALGAHVVLADACEIGDGAVLYAGVYVGRGARIGAGTVVYPNVTILDRVTVGARCILHSGVVLGADGFGFAAMGGVQHKIPQVGTVVVGDDVEIGANSAVDRATFGVTRIGNGTKIDNLVQIGHNVSIGEHCIFSGNAGIAGSAVIGNHVTAGARSGIGGHLTVGDGARIAALAGVTKSVKPGQTVSGYPAMDHERDMRIQAGQRMVPEALRRLRAIEQRLRELEEQVHGKTADDS